MLTVLFGEQFDTFRHILEFYLPEGARILDVTYGHGKLWQTVGKAARFRYEVVTNDIDPESPAQFHVPITELPSVFPWHSFDAIIYDPPYKYDKPSYILYQRSDQDWTPIKTKWSIELQKKCAFDLNNIAPVLLKREGFLIVKIMDTRYKGELVLNHKLIIDSLTRFELIDLLVYIRTLVGLFKNEKHAQTAHGYFLVFKVKGHHPLTSY